MSGDIIREAVPTRGPVSSVRSVDLHVRNRTAWERLVSLYAPLVYHWCRAAGLPPIEAAAVSQEVFRVVSRTLGDFRGDRTGEAFHGWLRKLTNEQLRARPAAGSAHDGDQVHGGGSPMLAADAEDDRDTFVDDGRLSYLRAVEAVRAEFPASHWQAFWRVVVEDQDAAEVARQLQMPTSAVFVALYRIGCRLREAFAGLADRNKGP